MSNLAASFHQVQISNMKKQQAVIVIFTFVWLAAVRDDPGGRGHLDLSLGFTLCLEIG